MRNYGTCGKRSIHFAFHHGLRDPGFFAREALADPAGQDDGADEEVGIVRDEAPQQAQRGRQAARNELAEEVGEHELRKSAAARRGTEQDDDAHDHLPREDDEVVDRGRMERENQAVHDRVAGCPGGEGAGKGVEPELPVLVAQSVGSDDELTARFERRMLPAAQQRQREGFHEQPLHETRVHEEGVRDEELVGEDDEIDGPERIEEPFAELDGIHVVQVHGGEEPFPTDGEIHQRRHQRQEDAVLERAEHDGRDALAHVDLLAVEDEDGEEEPSADHARRERRGEFPEHDDVEGAFPVELVVGERADPDHVGPVADHHHDQGHEDPERTVPTPGDVGKGFGVEAAHQQIGGGAEAEDDRQQDARRAERTEELPAVGLHGGMEALHRRLRFGFAQPEVVEADAERNADDLLLQQLEYRQEGEDGMHPVLAGQDEVGERNVLLAQDPVAQRLFLGRDGIRILHHLVLRFRLLFGKTFHHLVEGVEQLVQGEVHEFLGMRVLHRHFGELALDVAAGGLHRSVVFEYAQVFAGFLELLVLQEALDQVLARIDLVALLVELRTRQQHLGLDPHQRGRDQDELTRQLDVELVHLADVFQKVVGDLGNRDVMDVHLVAFDEEQQEVERPVELGQVYFEDFFHGKEGLVQR